MNKNDLVWYACYGSNLSEDRLTYYIRGGTYPVNGVQYDPCTNTSLWKKTMVRVYPGRMYFSNYSPSWGARGVAFYDRNGEGKTVMKLYLITWEQFLEIRKKEGRGRTWYGKIEQLEEMDGIPVLTMTSSEPYGCSVPPCSEYVEVIRKALIVECGITEEAANKYLQGCMKPADVRTELNRSA